MRGLRKKPFFWYYKLMLSETIKTFKFIRQFRKFKHSEDEVVKQRALLYIKNMLKTEGGVFRKFIQYSGTSPKEMKEIQDLNQDKLEGIPLDEILKVLHDKLGDKADDITEISTDAIAASVGQVHFGKLKQSGNSDKIDIAIKIQYPNIKKTFINQLKVLNILPASMSITPLKKWGIDITSYQNELNHLIEQECDYRKEAAELDLWQEYLKNESHCFVPKVFHEYSNEFVLVQSLVDGVLIENVQEYWTQTEKKDIGEKLVKAYFYLLFKYRTMQGDTNHGNFLFNRKKQEVIFIDLGQTIHFEEKFINALIYILDKKYNEESYCSLSFFVALGFDKSKLENITPKLDLIINVLFEPLFTNFANDLNDWDYKKQLDLLLGEDKWWFRSAGGTDFFLFMKSFMGLKNLICKLNTKVFFKGILQNILKELNSNNITIPIVSSNEETHFESHSKNIKILIIDKNVEKVKMTLPFMAIFDIDQYLNEPMLETIKNQKMNLQEIIQNALKDGGLPKEVFRLEYDEKKIIVEFI